MPPKRPAFVYKNHYKKIFVPYLRWKDNFFFKMKQQVQLSVIILLLIAAYFPAVAQSSHKQGEILVMLEKHTHIHDLIESLYARYASQAAFKNKGLLSKRMNIYLMGFDPLIAEEEKLLQDVKAKSMVKLAQFNHYVQPRETYPNDSVFHKQWSLLNTDTAGQGADIDAVRAWDKAADGITELGDTIVTAIIDDGFDLNHEDLNFWVNRLEIPGNQIDDDANGFIDDYYGWNAYDSNGTIPAQSHGTHVAGIAGAIGDNQKGIAGVSWKTKIMSVAGSSIDEAIAVQAYNYVLEMRALYNETSGQKGAYVVVANTSFGIDDAKKEDNPIWCAMFDTMGNYGILNVASTANKNTNVDVNGDIPTTCTSNYLISVTNSDKSDELYGSAGYGPVSIDLAAPGLSIISTIKDGYGYKSGTSMASPHVTGAIAGMYDVACDTFLQRYKDDVSGMALAMKKKIMQSVDTLDAFAGKTVTEGRLNLYKAYFGMCVPQKDTIIVTIPELIVEARPNPVSGNEVMLIHNFGNAANPVSAVLYDLYGRKVDELVLNTSSSQIQAQTQLDVSHLSPGVYLLMIRWKENIRFEALKLVKM